MAGQFILGLDGGGVPIFKLSKPGVDVLTAAKNDLVFDIAWAAAQSLGFLGRYTRGSQLVNVPVAATGVSYTYNFAKTFAVAPLAFAWLESAAGDYFSPFYQWSRVLVIPGTGYQNAQNSFTYTISTTQLVMQYVNYVEDNPTGGSITLTKNVLGDYIFHWIVFQS